MQCIVQIRYKKKPATKSNTYGMIIHLLFIFDEVESHPGVPTVDFLSTFVAMDCYFCSPVLEKGEFTVNKLDFTLELH